MVRLLKRIVLFGILAGLVGYAVIGILRGPARSFTAALLNDKGTQGQTGTPNTNAPSFTQDQDRDGLSDAKEQIYDTDPVRADTDRDGTSDGDEVKKGEDPTTAGSSKISDNKDLLANLTVRYFEWARTIGNIDDPQLNDQAVGDFLKVEGLTRAQIPTVDDSELTLTQESGDDALKKYFANLQSVHLPEKTGSYLDLADEVIRTKRSSVLDDVIAGLQKTSDALRAIPTPKETLELQRKQLALLKALKNLFSDLYSIEHDPVLLMRDISWGTDLLKQGGELELQRRGLESAFLEQAPPQENNNAPNQ